MNTMKRCSVIINGKNINIQLNENELYWLWFIAPNKVSIQEDSFNIEISSQHLALLRKIINIEQLKELSYFHNLINLCE